METIETVKLSNIQICQFKKNSIVWKRLWSISGAPDIISPALV